TPLFRSASLRSLEAELGKSGNDHVQALRARLSAGVQAFADCVDFVLAEKNPHASFAGAVPLLKLAGIVAGGWQMARAAAACEQRLSSGAGDRSFYEAKLATARFYGDHVLVQAPALRETVVRGAAGVMALDEEQFLAA